MRRPRTRRRGDGRFADRVVVVTGAGGGIGRATVLAAAGRGARPVAADVDGDAVERTARLARQRGVPATAHVVDVADREQMAAFARRVADQHGVADVVVNNAGIGMEGRFLETSLEDWEELLSVNLWGVIHGARLFARQMVEDGTGGHIVNVASGMAYTPTAYSAAYSTSKAAVLMLSECMRADLADDGIGVSAICPGVVDTGIIEDTRFVGGEDPEVRRERAQRLFRRRSYPPERVAEAILDAVRDDRAVVPVSPEAVVGRWLSRLSPGLVRWLGGRRLLSR